MTSALTLSAGTFIQTTGTGYNTTIIFNSTLDNLTVFTHSILMINVTLLGIENVDSSNAFINFTGLDNVTVLYDNGTSFSFTGDIDLLITPGQQLFIGNFGVIVLSEGLQAYQRLQENIGIISYDLVNASNNGSIIGATWENDNILLTIINGVDYNVTSGGLFTIIDSDFIFRFLTITYNDIDIIIEQINTNIFNALITYTAQADTQLNTAAIAITLLILIALFLVFWVAFIRPMMGNKRDVIQNAADF